MQRSLIEVTCQSVCKDWEDIMKKMEMNSKVASVVIGPTTCE